jgi:hypothetical protein
MTLLSCDSVPRTLHSCESLRMRVSKKTPTEHGSKLRREAWNVKSSHSRVRRKLFARRY